MRILVALAFATLCPAQAPGYDVTSVKLAPQGVIVFFKITTDPGRLKADNASLAQLIEFAYHVPVMKIAGQLPPDRFDVEGKTDGAHTRAEHRLMLQNLLAERFGLRLHRETREMRVEALVSGKSPQLQAAEIANSDPEFHFRGGKLPTHVAVEGRSISLEDLADYLTDHYRERLIVDATGLKGVYDFTVDYEVDTEKVADPRVPFADARSSLMDDLVTALGLKIESGRRVPVEVLVIDHVSPPEPN
jgi:uncharacterized protein (TIGR03435 family)